MARFLLRDGPRYVLTPPEGSWLDISTFEQLCRQSQIHINAKATDEALICLQAADRLYTGDLFEGLAHCNKALAIDPLSEIAHEEAMQVFFAQGRREAIDRQYTLYLESLSHFDERPKSAALAATYRQLQRT